MKGRVLQRNWQKGIYSVAPLLRGHREPITGISVRSELEKINDYFVQFCICE